MYHIGDVGSKEAMGLIVSFWHEMIKKNEVDGQVYLEIYDDGDMGISKPREG